MPETITPAPEPDVEELNADRCPMTLPLSMWQLLAKLSWPDGLSKRLRKAVAEADIKDVMLTLWPNPGEYFVLAPTAFALLNTEIDRLKGHAESVITDLRLRSQEVKDGKFCLNVETRHELMTVLAASLANILSSAGASNYVEFTVAHPDFGPLTLTLQRQQGKTPGQVAAEVIAERDAARAEVSAACCFKFVGPGGRWVASSIPDGKWICYRNDGPLALRLPWTDHATQAEAVAHARAEAAVYDAALKEQENANV